MASPICFLALFSLLLLAGTNARKSPDAGGTLPKVVAKSDCHTHAQPLSKTYAKDFDTQPSATAFYGTGKRKETSSGKDFDTEPNISAFYGGRKRKETSGEEDFDTEPNLTAFYGDGKRKETSSGEDFDTEPNLTAFYENPKAEVYAKDFNVDPRATTF